MSHPVALRTIVCIQYVNSGCAQRTHASQTGMNLHRCFRYSATRNCAYSRGWSKSFKCFLPKELRQSPPWRILFFGTDDFSLATLKALNENRMNPDSSVPKLVESLEVAVVRPKETAKAHHSVLKYAEENYLTIHDWPIVVSPFKYDVGVLASFGRLIPENIIFKFPYGILNVHPSLLPRWRGAAPLVHTILNGDKETGISIMEIRPKYFDIGPLLLKVPFKVPENVTTSELSREMANKGAQVLMHTLPHLPQLEKSQVEQDTFGVRWAHKVTKEMTFIDWENQTCDSIDRQYRALHEMMPLRTNVKNQEIRLLAKRSNVNDSGTADYVKQLYGCPSDQVPPGSPLYCKKKKALLVKCKDGWVGFDQIAYKKTLSASDFASILKKSYRGALFTSPPCVKKQESTQTVHKSHDDQNRESCVFMPKHRHSSHFNLHLFESRS